VPRAALPTALFSGIVEEMGRVEALAERGDMKLWDGTIGAGWELAVRGKTVLEGATEGCSIAVNGVCLTVVDYDLCSGIFRVGLAPETLRRTNLNPAALSAGDPVNLERALAADGRNSGHFVQGHVDGTGEIVSLTPDGDSLWVIVKAPREIVRYIVPKGFIAVDGTSLTVCDVDAMAGTFSFMLIGYTQQHVVIPLKKAGDHVNLEADVFGKYAERSLAALEARVAALEAMLAERGA
jgi:riboflavin synthase